MNKIHDDDVNLFAGDGEMRAMLRYFDWSASPLGYPSTWPKEIRVLVRQLLASDFPMWVAWGGDLHMIYNDAYRQILLDKHPYAIARPVAEVWAELRSQIVPLLAEALGGKPSPLLLMPFDIMRYGKLDPVWFNFALSPVFADGAKPQVLGILCVITESTMLSRTRTATLQPPDPGLRFVITDHA